MDHVAVRVDCAAQVEAGEPTAIVQPVESATTFEARLVLGLPRLKGRARAVLERANPDPASCSATYRAAMKPECVARSAAPMERKDVTAAMQAVLIRASATS